MRRSEYLPPSHRPPPEETRRSHLSMKHRHCFSLPSFHNTRSRARRVTCKRRRKGHG